MIIGKNNGNTNTNLCYRKFLLDVLRNQHEYLNVSKIPVIYRYIKRLTYSALKYVPTYHQSGNWWYFLIDLCNISTGCEYV